MIRENILDTGVWLYSIDNEGSLHNEKRKEKGPAGNGMPFLFNREQDVALIRIISVISEEFFNQKSIPDLPQDSPAVSIIVS